MTDILTELSRFMFDMQMDTYEADQAKRDLVWADPGIEEFWRKQASAVIDFIILQGGLW